MEKTNRIPPLKSEKIDPQFTVNVVFLVGLIFGILIGICLGVVIS